MDKQLVEVIDKNGVRTRRWKRVEQEAASVSALASVPVSRPHEYQSAHSAPDRSDTSASELPLEVHERPEDYGLRYSETRRAIEAMRGDLEAEVTIYRSVPNGVSEINSGDWIALSKQYAIQHGYDLDGEGTNGTVLESRVRASDIYWDGNDLEEFGFDSDSPPSVTVLDNPLESRPSDPMTMKYVRNPQSSQTHVREGFGQDIEPAGRYMTQTTSDFVPEGWESGEIAFEKPLHIEWGEGGYDDEDNWKTRLHYFYDEATGEELSQSVSADGYDAIITHDKYGTSEIVDLTHLHSK